MSDVLVGGAEPVQGKAWQLLDWLGMHGFHDYWQAHQGPLTWEHMGAAVDLWESGLVRVVRWTTPGKPKAEDREPHYSIQLTDAGFEQIRRQGGLILGGQPRDPFMTDAWEKDKLIVTEMQFNRDGVKAYNRGDASFFDLPPEFFLKAD